MPIAINVIIGSVAGAAAFIAVMSFIAEPARLRFNALFVCGAGAAYLSGGAFGPWELLFTAVVTALAYRAASCVDVVDGHRLVGAAWACHTAWDVGHHLVGQPILPFLATSSAGCAITDAVLAAWFVAGAPRVLRPWRLSRPSRTPLRR